MTRASDIDPQTYAAFASRSFTWEHIERWGFRMLADLLTPDISVLDAGSGTGRVIGHLMDQGVRSDNIVGIEPAEELVAYARNRLPGVKFVVGDAARLPFKGGRFDLITANMVTQYLGRDAFLAFLDDAHRVLRPDGTLFIVGVYHAHSEVAGAHIGQWMDQQTPWGQRVRVFNHDLDRLLLDDSYFAGFNMDSGGFLEVAEQGARLPEAARYLGRLSRFAVRLSRVSEAERQWRIDSADQQIPALIQPAC